VEGSKEEQERKSDVIISSDVGSSNTGTVRSSASCPHCGKSLLESNLSQHIRRVHHQAAGVRPRAHGQAQQFACLLCGHSTKASWFRLVEHFKVHGSPEVGELECRGGREGCGLTFPSLTDLHKHFWTTHRKGVECTLCGMVVKSKAYMEGHMTGHSTAKDHSCSFCPKSFKTKVQLDIHESRHTGQGKYECSICGKRFPQKGEVKNHEQQHGEERAFTCDFCGKTFARDAYLRIHMKVHTKKGELQEAIFKKSIFSSEDIILSSGNTVIFEEKL